MPGLGLAWQTLDFTAANLQALQSLGMRNIMSRLSSALLPRSAPPSSAQAAFVCTILFRWLQGDKNLQPFEEGAERIFRA